MIYSKVIGKRREKFNENKTMDMSDEITSGLSKWLFDIELKLTKKKLILQIF